MNGSTGLTRLTRRPGRLAVALVLGLLLASAAPAAPPPEAMAATGARLVCQRSAITGRCWCKFSYGWRTAPAMMCRLAQ